MAKIVPQFFMLIIINTLLLWCEPILGLSECGISDFEPTINNASKMKNGTNHIYKGEAVEEANSLPWMATLIFKKQLSCTGTIISNKHILTAYHCVRERFGAASEDFYVSYGGVNTSTQPHKAAVQSIKTHPNAFVSNFMVEIYGRTFREISAANDIAIIELQETINFSSNVRPICLGAAMTISSLFVAGWGLTQPMCQKDPPPQVSDQLMVGKMLMASAEQCREYRLGTNNELNRMPKSLPFVNNTISLRDEFLSEFLKNQICAVPEPSMIEKGDSGGPLMSKIGKNNWVQVGVASITTCNPKEPQNTGGLSSHFNPIDCAWVEEVTNGGAKCVEHY